MRKKFARESRLPQTALVPCGRQLRLELEPDAVWEIRRRILAEREAGNIGHGFATIANAIATLSVAGETTPTEAEIARVAGYSTRTVGRAKVKLRELGLLGVRRRGARVRGVWRRISCEYQLALPLGPVLLKARPAPQHIVVAGAVGPNGQPGRTSQEERKKERGSGTMQRQQPCFQVKQVGGCMQKTLEQLAAESRARGLLAWLNRPRRVFGHRAVA